MAWYRKPAIGLPFKGEELEKCKKILEPLILTDEQITKLMKTFKDEMFLGLSKDPEKRKQTSLQMENTYVRTLLDGTEEGDFLALDLGSTNFRVLLCHIKEGKCESISRRYDVPQEIYTGKTSGVFDHLAESIYYFLEEEEMTHKRLPLGFTFSFPMIMHSIKKATLITWTKSFACPDGPGLDVVKLLEDSISRRGDFEVDVVAVLNDTTGTLLCGSYLDQKCSMGLILGSGCNAAYVEQVDNVDKWQGPKNGPPEVIIDIEWGALGDNGSLDFIKTEYDKEVDRKSNYVGEYTFEKLVGGHFIGDITRLALVRLAQEGLIFGGQVPEKLAEWGAFTSEHISCTERDSSSEQIYTEIVFKELGLDCTNEVDIAMVRYVCAAVSLRIAQLLSAVLLKHMNRSHTSVAIDGSVYRHHPKLQDLMDAWIQELAPQHKCDLIVADDGSGRGAAFVAAVATKSKTCKQ